MIVQIINILCFDFVLLFRLIADGILYKCIGMKDCTTHAKIAKYFPHLKEPIYLEKLRMDVDFNIKRFHTRKLSQNDNCLYLR